MFTLQDTYVRPCKHIYLHTRALSGQHSDPCALSALEPFFFDFSAARPRFVARLARSDSPQSRGPCPRADPPSPRPSRSASELARSRLRCLPHAPYVFARTPVPIYCYLLLLLGLLPYLLPSNRLIRAKRVSNCYIQKKSLRVCSTNLGFSEVRIMYQIRMYLVSAGRNEVGYRKVA